MPIKNLSETLRELREDRGLLLREVAAKLEIDPSLLSKIERGEKRPTRDHVIRMAEIYNADQRQLLISFLSEKLIYELGNDALAHEAIKAAEVIIMNQNNRK